MASPGISIILPTRNEGRLIVDTVTAIVETQSGHRQTQVEIVIVDDASTDGSCDNLAGTFPGVVIKVLRVRKRIGVPRARNLGASAATGRILFMTDAHVHLAPGWDYQILENIADNRVLAATIADPRSSFRGYGCSLVVPFMGTRWNREAIPTGTPVQIPSCAGTVLPHELFISIGGYDRAMKTYGAAEPEFGVRAWLSGAEVVAVSDLIVWHRFKSSKEADEFLAGLRPSMVHNGLRFGFLYLSELACLQMIRHYTQEFPECMVEAVRMLNASDVWKRRRLLNDTLAHDFKWFVDRFELKDQVGGAILV